MKKLGLFNQKNQNGTQCKKVVLSLKSKWCKCTWEGAQLAITILYALLLFMPSFILLFCILDVVCS